MVIQLARAGLFWVRACGSIPAWMHTTTAPRDRILAMTASNIQRELDNPFWSSLTTRHAHIAQGGALARRYPAAISPIAGVPGVGPANIAALQALVEVTKPGPFRSRTIELGNYLGIRERGRLIAMAGERTWVGDFREVSAICTHPDAQGRGYARALMGRVINRMLRAGETPFLHVESKNLRAIDLYLALGFVRRTEFRLLHAKRIS